MSQVTGNIVPYANASAYQKALTAKANPTPTFNFSGMQPTGSVAPLPVSTSRVTGTTTPVRPLPSLSPNIPGVSPQMSSSGYIMPSGGAAPAAPAAPIASAPAATGTGGVPGSSSNPYTSNNGTWSLGGAGGGTPPPANPAPPVLPQQTQQQTPTYSGLVAQTAAAGTQLQQNAQQESPEVRAARAALQSSQQNEGQALYDIQGSPHTMHFAQGSEAALRNQYLQQQNALTGALTSATATQGQQFTAQNQAGGLLASAASLANPQQVPYSNQYMNPLTGQPYGSGGSTSLNDAVSNVVNQLRAGTMTYSDATNALSGYGQGGINALQQALPQGFNIAQSNTLGTQQGSIGPALSYARSTLTNLKSALANLQVPGQTSNIPLLGGVANFVSSQTGVGSQQTTAKDGALAEARQALQAVLASVKGGTPTDYTGQSHAMLPDNATPAQVDAAIANLESLGGSKQNIYGNPGSAGSTSSGTVVQTSVGPVNPNF